MKSIHSFVNSLKKIYSHGSSERISDLLRRVLHTSRSLIVLGHDLLAALVTIPVSLFLRLGEDAFYFPPEMVLTHTLVYGLISLSVYLFFQIYGGVWRYFSAYDSLRLVLSILAINLLFLPMVFIMRGPPILPPSVLLLTPLIHFTLMSLTRFLYRLWIDQKRLEMDLSGAPQSFARKTIPVLLYGVNRHTENLIRVYRREATHMYNILGILDDSPNRIGRHIHGIEILGTLGDLPQLIESLDIPPKAVVLTDSDVEGSFVKELLSYVEKHHLSLVRLPKLFQEEAKSLTLQKLNIRDLLGHPPLSLDQDKISSLLKGKRILITGAGGSLGWELLQKLAPYAPGHLTLTDNTEGRLKAVAQKLKLLCPKLPQGSALVDVTESRRVQEIMSLVKPHVVFHLASLNQIQTVEENPVEGILTNLIGTRNVGEACREAHVEQALFLSSDRAVNPTTLFGATKRLGESYWQALDLTSVRANTPKTRFMTIRFGMVIDSEVSPLRDIESQLMEEGPIMIQSPQSVENFISGEDVASLALQSMTYTSLTRISQGGEVFVFESRSPSKLLDLVYQMIHLHGFTPGIDIDLEFGTQDTSDKLTQELFYEWEKLVPTPTKSILMGTPKACNYDQLARGFGDIETFARSRQTDQLFRIFCGLIPEYTPNPTLVEVCNGISAFKGHPS